MKKLILYFLLLLPVINNSVWAQNNGDYRSNQSGNWNSAANWEKYSTALSQWVYPAPEYPPLATPWITTKVTIQTGHTITMTGHVGGTTGGVLEVASGGTLNTGGFSIRGTGTQTSKFQEIIINGTLSTPTSVNAYVNSATFTIGSNGKFITGYIGSNGWWYSGSGPTVVSLSGEVEFNAATSQRIPGITGENYNNVITSNGPKTLTGNLVVEGLLTINAGSTLSISPPFYLSILGEGILVEGTLDGYGSVLNFDGGTSTISGNGPFGAAFQEINIGASQTSNVTLTNPNLLSIYNLSVTDATNSTFTLGANSKVNVQVSSITGDGLILKASQADPYISASLIIDDEATVEGNIQSEIFLTGGGNVDDNNYKWHYISTPVSSSAASIFTGTTDDLVRYYEDRPTLDLLQGWVAYDGYVYSSGTISGPTFSQLSPGTGYNFWDSADNTFTLTGSPNTTDVNANIGFGGNASLNGWNLLGNPFSSGLDWDAIINSASFPSGTSKSLYFTRNNSLCYYIGTVGVPGDVTGIIPPMQGFFIKTSATGNITFAASARTHNNTHPRYKGSSDVPLVRLLLKRNNTVRDETVVRFDEEAKTGFDYDFDAYKMFISTSKTLIYSTTGGASYAINGQPYPETFIEIPLTVNITKDTIHTISATQLQGLGIYNVTLKDNISGITTDLKTTPSVTFTGSPGSITGRFILKISTSTTGLEQPLATENKFNIYSGNSIIRIRTVSDEWEGKSGSVKILDITGKPVSILPDVEFRKESEIIVPCTGKTGIYLVEIKSGLMRYVRKVVLK